MNGKLISLRVPAITLAMGMSMNAMAGLFGLGSTNWKEEVLLHDGSRIIVERSVERRGRHEIGQRPGATHETLTFVMPGTGEIVVWEDEFSEDIRSSNFNLLMLGIRDGATYLVASPMGCLSYNKWGRPNPPYVAFRHQGKDWQRIALQELPSELKTPNLVISSPDDAAENAVHGVVPAEVVRRLNSTAKQPEYKTILRDAVAGVGNECIKTDYYGKGGWLSPDWFTDQPSLDACLRFCSNKKIDVEVCPCNSIFQGKGK